VVHDMGPGILAAVKEVFVMKMQEGDDLPYLQTVFTAFLHQRQSRHPRLLEPQVKPVDHRQKPALLTLGPFFEERGGFLLRLARLVRTGSSRPIAGRKIRSGPPRPGARQIRLHTCQGTGIALRWSRPSGH